MDNTELHETLERCADVIREMIQKLSEMLRKLADSVEECLDEIDRRVESLKRNRFALPMAVMAVIAISNIAANKPPRECMHPT